MDPARWRESVLSTRSLSYISNAGSFVSPIHHSSPVGRQSNTAYSWTPSRKSATNSECSEEDDLEMAGTYREASVTLDGIPELPESVAHSRLFELPREIRDRIYTMCLTARDGLPVEWPRPRDSPEGYDLQPQLLRTCRIIHGESAPLLYTLSNMTFHHPSDANMFVHSFASPAAYVRQISNLSLHIKAQDMRLWMPYLTSTDESRSLRADFPNLKELGVRYRSNKWQHSHTPEANLKSWSDDSRLQEVIDGLRHALLTSTPLERTHISEREFQSYMARNPTALQEEGDTIQFRRRLLELLKTRAKISVPRPDAPAIRVCCACRVHSTHFNALTTPAVEIRLPNTNDRPLPQAAAPVQEGEAFRGFTAVDLQNGVKRLHDPDLGSANVARTFYTNKGGVLLALEIHCLDPKRDGAERAA